MSGHDSGAEGGPSLISRRAMEIGLALFLMLIAAIAVYDSIRTGFQWREDGPAPGFFPFWIGIILATASLINLVHGLNKEYAAETFVTKTQFGRVLAVLVPTIAYVALIAPLGIYLASAIFICGFMLAIGKQSILKSVLVGVCVPLAVFFLFEKWFLVPLPKGPIEAALGLG